MDSIKSSNTHIYQALDYAKNEIRVLSVSPGAGDDAVECELVHTVLDMPFPYQAISYTWGDSLDMRSIILNGQNFTIGRNAYEVLKALRSANDYQFFWIDAICINQSNNSERNHQVRNMRSIYSKAFSVRAWLGPSQNGSQEAFQLVSNLYRLHGDNNAINCLFKDPALTTVFVALAHLFTREFWTRIWVVQEIAAASHCIVHCGADSIMWAELLEVSMTLSKLQAQSYYALKTLENTFPVETATNLASGGPSRMVFESATTDETALPIVRLAEAVSHYQRYSCCTDPRDKIYALLGMAFAEEVLRPDYGYSVYEVYTKFIQQVVRETANLDIICNNIPKVNNFSLQSWTPDWWSEPTSFCRNLPSESGISCAAAKCSRAKVTFIERSKNSIILRAKGFQLDQLQTCGNSAISILSLEDLIRYFVEWRDMVIPSGSVRLEAYKVFFKTVCFGRVMDGFPLMAFISATKNVITLTASDKAFLKSWEVLTDTKNRKPQISDATKEQLENQVLSILRMVMKGRRFFISSSGRIGMAPAEADIGDKICILLGCSFPVILRLSDDAKYCTLIGEAYFHEYMEGAGIDELEKGRYTLQNFNLL